MTLRRVGFTSVAWIGLLTFAASLPAKKVKPQPCPEGSFLVMSVSLVGGTPEAITISNAQLSVGGICPAVAVKLKPRKKFTSVTAKWRGCGSVLAGRVTLQARIAAPDCNIMTGLFRARKAKVNERFEAHRSMPPVITGTTTTTGPTAVTTTTTSTTPTATTRPPTTTTQTTTTTMTLRATTTTTTTLPSVTCEPLVRDGQGISGTYQLLAVPGQKLCQTNATQNRFGPCNTDADCGGGQDNCSVTPFATAGGVVLPFPQGIKTVFTIPAEDPAPPAGRCDHAACIPCGNETALCAGLPGCGTTPGQPDPGCLRNQCCDAPGFTIPTFLVPLLGGLCSRLDMYRCGFGVVNSSNPQVGDNEVTKTGDTSDPGPDCEYGTADDPPAKPCNTTDAGAGHDLKGKVVRTVGNGAFDANGIQYRLSVPSLSTTWSDMQSPPGTCMQGSTFDTGELIITQLILNAEFTTAGATGSFADLNGDNCARAGAGFTNFSKDGPFTLASPPAAPQPYDTSSCPAGSACSTAVSAGIALSGGGPLFDIGFIAVLTNAAMTRLPTQACSCAQAPGCPE